MQIPLLFDNDDTDEDAYELLGVDRSAPKNVIKLNYKKLVYAWLLASIHFCFFRN